MKEHEIFESDDDIKDELIQASRQLGREALKERFSELNKTAVSKPLQVWLAVAAIGIALIAVILVMRPSKNEVLYADFYEKLPNKMVPITRGAEGDAALKMAMISYIRGDYDASLTDIINLEPIHPDIKIYKAMIAMEESEFETAIPQLQSMVAERDYKFKDEARWYLALAYLKLDLREKTVEILKELIEETSGYSSKAALLLKELE